ncbi:uncharacterized protein B0T23DRAFT_369399 [Neurospora hispaniola]|uniref:Uncharacterized protein n=1 Tax=Neurospora hispaniola TaxID=588809 RepID=A0AAJ0IF23_9PEZI|nr:hypothetical protein B0T23DRAFT_369399 [Neurospora hispaniola]
MSTQRQEEDRRGSERAGKSPDICMNRGLRCGSRLYSRPMIMLMRLQACLSACLSRMVVYRFWAISAGSGEEEGGFLQDIPGFLFALLTFDVAGLLWLAGWLAGV